MESERRAPDAPADGDARYDAASAAALEMLVGGWLIVSPLALGYARPGAAWNAAIAGAVVVALAGARLARPLRGRVLDALIAVSGVWLASSALWFATSSDGAWNTIITGLLLVFLAGYAAAATSEAAASLRRRGTTGHPPRVRVWPR